MSHTNALCQPGWLAGHSRMGTGCPHCLCAVTRLRGWQRWLWPFPCSLVKGGGPSPSWGPEAVGSVLWDRVSVGVGKELCHCPGAPSGVWGEGGVGRIYGPRGLALAKGLVLAQRLSAVPSTPLPLPPPAEARPSPHRSRARGGPAGLEGHRGHQGTRWCAGRESGCALSQWAPPAELSANDRRLILSRQPMRAGAGHFRAVVQ